MSASQTKRPDAPSPAVSDTPAAWNRWDVLGIAIIGCGAVLAAWQLWRPGVRSENDMLLGIYRVFAADRSFQQRVFFPRLAPDIFCGFGGPLFQYYPPLATYGALVFHWAGLGYIEASKAVFSLALLLAGLGAYTYARWLFGSRLAAFVAGIAYLFAPYLLLDVYERGALAELLAVAMLPWVFWATHHILRSTEQARFWTWLSAGLIALLLLAHNITAFFALPLIFVYLLLIALRNHAWERLTLVCLAFAGGLALSAFYWIPAIAERSLTQIDSQMLKDAYLPWQHLATLNTLIQPGLIFNYWGNLRFRVASWQAILSIVAAIAIIFQHPRRRWSLAVLAGLLGVLVLLQLDVSGPFWIGLPLVRYIQFPWRLLGPISLIVALLAASLFLLRPLQGRAGAVVAALLAVFILFAGMGRLYREVPARWYDLPESEIGVNDLYERGSAGYALFTDFQPVAMRSNPCDPSAMARSDAAPAAPLSAAPAISLLQEGPFEFRFTVDAPAPFTLRLPRTYFPNWQARVGGVPVSTGPHGPLGLVAADIPAGRSEVTVRFEDTPVRRIGAVVSILSLLAFIGIGLFIPRARLILAIAGGLLALSALLMLAHQGLGESPRRPVASQANFEDKVHLLGYELPATTAHAGDTLPVRLYWFVQETPDEDATMFLHVSNPEDTAKVAQSDTPLMGGVNPPARWTPGELIVEERTVELGPDIPPGPYRLLIGLYRLDGVKNYEVRHATEVLPGDRVALGNIEIQGD